MNDIFIKEKIENVFKEELTEILKGIDEEDVPPNFTAFYKQNVQEKEIILTKIKINNKNLNLIDESYNSNPLSLKSAILNFDKIKINRGKKYLLLGDMLELGKHSKKLHQSIGKMINDTKLDKIFVRGRKVLSTYNSISKKKKGRVLKNNSQIIDLIKNDLNNNDFIMVKASNATGLNKIIDDIKGSK